MTASTDIAHLRNRENRPPGDCSQQREPYGRAVASHAAATELPTDCSTSTHWREVAWNVRRSLTSALAAAPTVRRSSGSAMSSSRIARISGGGGGGKPVAPGSIPGYTAGSAISG